MADEPVEYRSVTGFPGYRVGSDGSAWTCRPRNGRGGLQPTWAKLTPLISGRYGYRKLILRTGTHYSNFYVHRLVLESFVGPPPAGQEARHLNGDTSDNRVCNLAWGTSAENKNDMKKHGTIPVGERNGAAKLTDADVQAIREKAAAGVGYQELAKQYGVTGNWIGHIVRRQKRNHA